MKTKKNTKVRRNKKGQFKKKNKLSLTKLILIAIVCFGIYKAIPVQEAHSKEVTFETVCVSKGDTLWSIATPYAEEFNKDVRDIIHTIRKDNNNMSANLEIGQEILVRTQF